MKKEFCKNCTFYSAFYKQWSDGYNKLNKGTCSKNSNIQEQYDICEYFKSNEPKEEMRSKRRLASLDRAIISINEIAHILKEKEIDD